MSERRGPKGPMSEEHKAKLAQGRADARSVKGYLEALRANKPKRGRKRTPDSIKKRLTTIEEQLAEAEPLDELKLIEERRRLQEELESLEATVDIGELEDEFVRVAKGYSERQGISYASWRDVGVEPAVLKRAGISRSS
ncbi:MAG: hypothetical protein WD225_06535 [Ilumatobacteraceae bacterium]